MDTRSNHLVRDVSILSEEDRRNYTRIPDHLQADAERELAGRESAYVNRNGNLKRWAERKEKKKRARAKAARASRKKNR